MTVPYRIGLAGVAVIALAVASCAPRRPPPAEAPPPVVEVPAARPLTTAAYFQRAASIDLYQVRSGELALQRSGIAANRDIARRMMVAHRGLAAQLSLAGRRLNLLPPTNLQAEQQAWLSQLEGAAPGQFDAVYRRQQVLAHETSLRMHAVYGREGDSPTLRMVARSAAGIEQEHSRMVKS